MQNQDNYQHAGADIEIAGEPVTNSLYERYRHPEEAFQNGLERLIADLWSSVEFIRKYTQDAEIHLDDLEYYSSGADRERFGRRIDLDNYAERIIDVHSRIQQMFPRAEK